MSLVADLKYDTHRTELVDFVPGGTQRLLDIGCAGGRYAAEVAGRHPRIELWGIEPDADNAAAAAPRFHTLVQGFFPAVLDQLPSSYFDTITFNDVLEHVVEPAETLAATEALLTPDGRVVASIPNVRHRSVIWPLVREARWDYEEYGLLDRTHLRFFTRPTMRALFEDLGWTVESIEGVNPRWHWSEGRERRLVRLLRRWSRHRLDDFFFVQYVVTAKPPHR